MAMPGSKAAGGTREVPRGLGLGCWEFSDIGSGAPPDEPSIKMIRAAWDMGLTHFDTAQSYGDGHSESVVGAALEGIRGTVHRLQVPCGGQAIDDQRGGAISEAAEARMGRSVLRALARARGSTSGP